eukprot:1065037_1
MDFIGTRIVKYLRNRPCAKDGKSHPHAMKQGAAVNIILMKSKCNKIYYHGTMIIKNSASHLHHRCHDAMSDNDYLIKCDNYTISYPGYEDKCRYHCSGHFCLNQYPKPSVCGCHGGNSYIDLQKATEQQIGKAK